MRRPDVLDREYSATLRTLTRATVVALAGLWGSWQWDEALGVKEAAGLLMPGLVWAYQDAAAMVAADFYDDARIAEGVPGAFLASPAALSVEEQLLSGIGFAISPLFSGAPDVGAAQSNLAGIAVRHVTRAAADTIVGATRADPKAVGWQRYARPTACSFCRMLSGRGSIGVYRSEKSARFASHDHCHCTAFPSWDRDAPEVDVVAYVASAREQTPASRARVKAYLEQMD